MGGASNSHPFSPPDGRPKTAHTYGQKVCMLKEQDDCIIHVGATTLDGYGVVKRQGKVVRAHRWSLSQSLGISIQQMDGLVVMHSCDNRLCVNPSHLSLGTHKENAEDKVKKGRQAKGETCGNSRLTDDQVRAIKTMFGCGVSSASIARAFGVSAMCIGRIRSGKTWRHL